MYILHAVQQMQAINHRFGCMVIIGVQKRSIQISLVTIIFISKKKKIVNKLALLSTGHETAKDLISFA